MGEFAIPIMIAATVGSGVLSAKAQRDAGIAAKNEAHNQAVREGDAARGREIERRRRLLQALASQSATAGAQGASPDWSVATSDISYAQNDILTDQSNTIAEQNALRARGRNARRAGNIGAITSLLDTAGSVAGTFGGKTPKAKGP